MALAPADAASTGTFTEREFGNTFEFRGCENPWGIEHGATHEIYVEGGTRCAKVLKTVAYVAVDEAADGSPVWEKWSIRNCRNW